MELMELLSQVKMYIENPTKGLPEEVFLFATEITPMVNVDLLIRDEEGRILLSWREDEFCGCGWHVPGGIVRLKETFEERIQKTALKEIGCTVEHSLKPIDVIPIIHKNQVTRGHFITFIYECKIPIGQVVTNENKCPGSVGYLEWHSKYPKNMILVHDFYKKHFLS